MPLAGASTGSQGPHRAVGGHWGACGLCGSEMVTVTHSPFVPGVHTGQGGRAPPALLPSKPLWVGGHHLRRGWRAVVGEGSSPCPLLIPPPFSSPTRTAAMWSVHTSQVSPTGRRQPWTKRILPGVPCISHPIWASCNLSSLSGGCRDCLECLSECLGVPAAPAPHLPHPCSLQCSPVPAPGCAV